MLKVPPEMKSALDNLVSMLNRQETISGVALFGSWSRRDATASSDVDLLVVHTQNLKYEYVTRFEFERFLVDLDYIPASWLSDSMLPEIDQKIFEANVLYDREGVLNRAKEWMSKAYQTPERVGMRTEAHLISSDTFLSRATSARARRDLQSTKVFSIIAVEQILRILLEVSLLPFSNTRFVEALKKATGKTGMESLYDGYFELAGLSKVNDKVVAEKISLFRDAFEVLLKLMKERSQIVDSLHPQVKRALQYYGNEDFLKGVISRSKALVDEKKHVEAFRYTSSTLECMLENYAWLKAKSEGTRPDSATLFLTLRRTGDSDPVYRKAAAFLNLDFLTEKEADNSLAYARKAILSIREARKDLVKRYVK